MFKIVLFCILKHSLHCFGQKVSYNLTVHLSIKRTWIGEDSVKCANSNTQSFLIKWIRGQLYQARYDISVSSDFRALKDQVLSTSVFCTISIKGSSEFYALLDKNALSNKQPGINGSFTILAHVEDLSFIWMTSVACETKKSWSFLEIKEFNLSYTYVNIPPLLVAFLKRFRNLYCSNM